ncbi:MAG: apolipoprotein N-acyltransferase, partial [Alphaproteobacteria bacterium]|nr:apolipoprotein N-acyltransferase [Alphaproteobacteria bacterium]
MAMGAERARAEEQPKPLLLRWAGWYRTAAGRRIDRRPFLVLFASGAVSTLAMAPLHLWPVLLLTLPVLLWAIDDDQARGRTASLRSALWRGWAFGFGYQFAGLYWIGFSFLVQAEQFAVFMPFAILALTASLGLFFGVAAAAFALARHYVGTGLPRVLLLGAVIMVAEWLRGHIFTGFPWNVLGYALTMPLPLMQWAGLFGIYVLTAITVITLTAPLAVLAADHPNAWRTLLAATVLPLGLAVGYGAWQLSANPTVFDQSVRLRLVQPSFTQKEKFVTSLRGPIFLRHLEMSSADLVDGASRPAVDRPTHIIWPEAAIPFFIRRDRSALARLDHALPDDVLVVAGSYRTN